jgi:hypothetical protein
VSALLAVRDNLAAVGVLVDALARTRLADQLSGSRAKRTADQRTLDAVIAIGHGQATGVHITSSIRGAPVASITTRSNPIAIPLAAGIMCQGRQEILIQRVVAPHRPGLFPPSPPRTAAAARRVGQLAEPVRQLDPASIDLEPLGHPSSPGTLRASAASAAG